MHGTLLLCDDDDSFRNALARAFTRKGFHVLSTGTAEQALEFCSGQHVDYAIVDLNMPGTNGFWLLS